MNPEIILIIPVLIFAIVVHECAHGWVAYKLGDPTAKTAGRLTLNPLPHIDPIGTVVLPLTLLLLRYLTGMGFIFAWAKPVPVNPVYFSNPRKGMLLVGLAGPVSNFLQAILMALLIRLVLPLHITVLSSLLFYGVLINIVLGVLNLLPVPPLDGSRILTGLLPLRMARAYSRLEPMGMFIIILLFSTGFLGAMIWPIIGVLMNLLLGSSFQG
ncbi:MAG: site-2 protease family protein [Candidatus Omnitrophica bacterium]|nr:site-2 protease family protein [Candidatus Omnitrophota bacterium]MCK4423583.1 site-2 protease family protein [Candidatus Omnitrophota bacterium]